MNKIALGTAQFGLDYGITNQNGRIDICQMLDILKCAKCNGINTIDTAPSYGGSEKHLGNIGMGDFQIITKTVPFQDSIDNVIEGFYQSLARLKKNKIYGLLIHDIDDIYQDNFFELFQNLSALKEQGLIEKIGFSTYTPEQVDFLLDNFVFDLIQVPLNVFDQRLVNGGQLKRLKKKSIEIHARSIFLQGALLSFKTLPSYFNKWQCHFDNYCSDISAYSLLEGALGFPLSIKELDCMVIGINSVKQLNEIFIALKTRVNIDFKQHAIDDVCLLNPSLWEK